jgi:hypothetical protein
MCMLSETSARVTALPQERAYNDGDHDPAFPSSQPALTNTGCSGDGARSSWSPGIASAARQTGRQHRGFRWLASTNDGSPPEFHRPTGPMDLPTPAACQELIAGIRHVLGTPVGTDLPAQQKGELRT